METKTKKKQKLILNVSNSKYDVIRHVGKKLLGFKLKETEDDNWDLFWTDTSINPGRLSRMKPFQKINHFPEMINICRKNLMAINLNKFRKLFPKEYNFYPQTWILPSDIADFKAQLSKRAKRTYIVKPDASAQGKGIYLVNKPEQLACTESCVAQEYLKKPFLINGLKFDLRIYVLVAGCDPLRIFIFKDGLARFATETYKAPQKNNLEKTCMHLTNYAVNKRNPNFIKNQNPESENSAHKRSIVNLFQQLTEEGHNCEVLWQKICDIVVKTILTIQPTLAHTYRSCQPEDTSNSMCFEVLGFDIMLDKKLKPWLLEVNHSPSFTTDSSLDRRIKRQVISEAIQLMNLTLKSKKLFLKKQKKQSWERTYSKKYEKESKESLKAKEVKKRTKYEASLEVNYQLIYPSETNKYQKFEESAMNFYTNFTQGRRKRNESQPPIVAPLRKPLLRNPVKPIRPSSTKKTLPNKNHEIERTYSARELDKPKQPRRRITSAHPKKRTLDSTQPPTSGSYIVPKLIDFPFELNIAEELPQTRKRLLVR